MSGSNTVRYEDRVLCFVDILGFGSQIHATLDAQGNDHPERIKTIADAFLRVRALLDIDKPDLKRGRPVTQFSASIVSSFPKTERSEVFYTLLELLDVQLTLIESGLLCRGAVVEGKVIHTDEMLFGPALAEAYELESKAALFPRIILGESLFDVARSAHALHHGPSDEMRSIVNLLARDTDQMWYIDYITKGQ